MTLLNRNSALAALATTLVVAGCSGGSNSPARQAGAASGPTISAIADQTVAQDATTGPIAFTVTDPDSDPATLALSVSATNVGLISPDGIVLSGTGGNRAITLTPNEGAFGPATITVTAKDPQGATTSRSFMLQVTTMPVSFKSFASQTVAADENTAPRTVLGLTFGQDADDPTSFDSLLSQQP